MNHVVETKIKLHMPPQQTGKNCYVYLYHCLYYVNNTNGRTNTSGAKSASVVQYVACQREPV